MDGRKLREGKLVQEFSFSKVIRVHVAFPFYNTRSQTFVPKMRTMGRRSATAQERKR